MSIQQLGQFAISETGLVSSTAQLNKKFPSETTILFLSQDWKELPMRVVHHS
jgi:hypothetical protein